MGPTGYGLKGRKGVTGAHGFPGPVGDKGGLGPSEDGYNGQPGLKGYWLPQHTCVKKKNL